MGRMRGVGRNGVILVGTLLVGGVLARQFLGPAQTIARPHDAPDIDVGTPDAPVAGILLGREPQVILQRLKPDVPIPPGVIALDFGESAFFSPDRRRLVRARNLGTGTRVGLPSGKVTDVEQESWFEADSSGSRVVAVAETHDEDGHFPVRVLDEAGGILATIPSPEPVWVSVARAGKRIAIGTLEGVQVIDAQGTTENRFVGETALGSLSEDGLWLAFELVTAAGRKLVVEHLGQQGQQVSELVVPVSPGTGLVISPDAGWLAQVGSGELLLLSLGPSPVVQSRRSAPAGQEWRDVAFDRERLCVSWIRVEQPLKPAGDARRVVGSAHVGFDVQPLAGGSAGNTTTVGERPVRSWDAESPELVFDGNGRLFARVWPTAFEVALR